MTSKQIEHLISNWENARLDPVACIPSGDKLVEALKEMLVEIEVLQEENIELQSELNQSGDV
jgi:hypothetical protein